jgi:hypothetical protein
MENHTLFGCVAFVVSGMGRLGACADTTGQDGKLNASFPLETYRLEKLVFHMETMDLVSAINICWLGGALVFIMYISMLSLICSTCIKGSMKTYIAIEAAIFAL